MDSGSAEEQQPLGCVTWLTLQQRGCQTQPLPDTSPMLWGRCVMRMHDSSVLNDCTCSSVGAVLGEHEKRAQDMQHDCKQKKREQAFVSPVGSFEHLSRVIDSTPHAHAVGGVGRSICTCVHSCARSCNLDASWPASSRVVAQLAEQPHNSAVRLHCRAEVKNPQTKARKRAVALLCTWRVLGPLRALSDQVQEVWPISVH
jgi:hypothetical protein